MQKNDIAPNGTKSKGLTNPFSSYTFHVNMHSYSEYSQSKYVYMYVSILAVYTTVTRH